MLFSFTEKRRSEDEDEDEVEAVGAIVAKAVHDTVAAAQPERRARVKRRR